MITLMNNVGEIRTALAPSYNRGCIYGYRVLFSVNEIIFKNNHGDIVNIKDRGD